jgi:hypothetical protein
LPPSCVDRFAGQDYAGSDTTAAQSGESLRAAGAGIRPAYFRQSDLCFFSGDAQIAAQRKTRTRPMAAPISQCYLRQASMR